MRCCILWHLIWVYTVWLRLVCLNTYIKFSKWYFRCEKTSINITTNTTEDVEFVCRWDYNGQGIEYQLIAGPIFIVIYTFAGIFISFAADRYNRKMMLAGCLIWWSVMTLATGFVNSYWQLALLRFGLGLG